MRVKGSARLENAEHDQKQFAHGQPVEQQCEIG